MAVIHYRATTVQSAFILNALAAALIAIITVQVKQSLDKYRVFENNVARIFVAFLSGFLSALVIYWAMYFIFDFGGGMLASPMPVKATGVL